MINFVKTFDYLGKTPTFLHEGNQLSKSFFGGIISILFSTAFMGFFIYNLYLFITNTPFTVIENTKKITNATKVFKKGDFSVTFFHHDLSEFSEIERFLSLSGELQIYKNHSIIKEKIKFIKCSFEPPIGLSVADEISYSSSYCLDLSSYKQNLSIINENLGNYFAKLIVSINFCDNQKQKFCILDENSKNQLLNTYVYFRILDYYFDNDSKDNPAIPNLHSELFTLSFDYNRIKKFIFQNVEYDSDNGSFFESIKKINVSSLYSIFEEIQPNKEQKDIFTLEFFMSNKMKIIKRKYEKIQDFLNTNFSVLFFLYIIAGMITFCSSTESFFLSIVNANINNYLSKQESFQKNDGNSPHQICKKPSSSSIYAREILVKQQQQLPLQSPSSSSNRFIFKNGVNSLSLINPVNQPKFPTKPNFDPKKILGYKIKLSILDLMNPILFGCPKAFTNHDRRSLKLFSRFRLYVMNQIEISKYVKNVNIIDKISCLLIGKNNYHLLEDCVNINLSNDWRKEKMNKPGKKNSSVHFGNLYPSEYKMLKDIYYYFSQKKNDEV